MAYKILLLEDDLSLGEILCDVLEDFEVSLCKDAQEALNLAYEKNFDLWIFDVKVPNGNGFDVLKALRESGKQTPCVFLTSLSMIDDLKEGFLAGCDDYIKKPFDVDELVLRIQNILKRKFQHKNEDFIILNSFENIRFNIKDKSLYKNDTRVNITNKEEELLSLLLENKMHFVSIEQIFDRIWDYDKEPSLTSLRVYIKNLRKILGKESIQMQRHKGYALMVRA